ncbi:TIGR02757 family protein [Planobacterium oryzisoli]|uniref:TIGR02757 family protein n=1 Tax=Planobacterium oryzisoli TaxID=2771435 RepID=A0A931EAW1_9FLAO|nr:TIGR02757 family protein [Planobacterium oryzisoli]MBF5027608.1 TIGR02757 family protein [Planobacterium oryzisoli]
MEREMLKDFLDEKVDLYNHPSYIDSDPIQIPHRFSSREDTEIMAFLMATIAWGNRKSIIASGEKMLDWMGNSPHDFILNHSRKDLQSFEGLPLHRTFSGEDFAHFAGHLKRIFSAYGSLEPLLLPLQQEENYYHALYRFRCAFLLESTHRSCKHVSSTYKNSAAKRLLMFLRWMVRRDSRGVDFGLYTTHPAHKLSLPLDVHVGNIARALGILSRRQNDWKAVEELDLIVRTLDPKDPGKYDYALFGLGVSGDFSP